MSIAPYQRIIDSARANLPGALEGPMQLELFNVMKEFVQRSNVWTGVIAFEATPQQIEYEIVSENGSAFINRLLWLEGKRGSNDGHYGSPVPASLLDAGGHSATLRLDYAPGGHETWRAHVAYGLTDPTDKNGYPRLPDSLIDKYQLPILSGLLSRMMAQPAKPYSNPQMAQFHWATFHRGISQAKTELLKGHTFRGQNWRFPGQFRTRRKVF